MTDHTRYTHDSLDDPYALIKAILIAQRANEESEIKSRRMRSAWKKKREDAERTGKIITRSCPRWLKISENKESFLVDESRAKTVNKIFKLRLKGHSLNGITKILNDKKIMTFTGEISAWNPTTIEKLLGNKALIGTYVPSYRTMSKGVREIPGYFPAVITEKLFNDVQAVRLSPYGRDSNFNNPYLVNMFRSVMRCKCCGHSIMMSGIDGRGMGYYVCPMRRLHRCDAPAIRRDTVDAALVGTLVSSLDWLHGNFTDSNAIKSLETTLLDLQMKMNRLIDALQVAPDVEQLALKVKELSRELHYGEIQLRSLKSRHKAMFNLDVSGMDLSDGKEREKCRDYIGRKIEKIILDTSCGRCDVYLTNGVRIIDFPLLKKLDKQSFISSLEYIDGETLFF